MDKEIVGIKIGVEKEAVEEAGKTIINILHSEADQDTIKTALNTLKEICNITNASVQNCSVNMNEDVKEEYVTTATTY